MTSGLVYNMISMSRNLKKQISHKSLQFIAFFAVSLMCASVINVDFARADSAAACTGNYTLSYTGESSFSETSYDVYVRLARQGEKATVSAGMMLDGNATDCQVINGGIEASGDHWTKLASIEVEPESEYTFELLSSLFADMPDANRPSLMFVSKTNPVCVPSTECYIDLKGEKGYIRPSSGSLTDNMLRMMTVVDPAEDTVQKVNYYIDNHQAYSSNVLKDFDTRYAQHAGQEVNRVVEYKSGQHIVLPYDIPDGYSDSFGNFMFRIGNSYPKTTSFVVYGLGALVLIWLILWVVGLISGRSAERRHHGFVQEGSRQLTDSQRKMYVIRHRVMIGLKVTTAVCFSLAFVIVFILGTDRYVAQIFSVDGVSMQKGYATGDKLFVNRLPKTLADMNGRQYLPGRGQIVIVRSTFGDTVYSAAEKEAPFLVKRVIGLPGERIVIADGTLTVYNEQNPEGFSPDTKGEWSKYFIPNLKTEKLDLSLGDNEIFVIGDNRPESIDSRYNGPISTGEIIGKVEARIWPLDGKTDQPENAQYK